MRTNLGRALTLDTYETVKGNLPDLRHLMTRLYKGADRLDGDFLSPVFYACLQVRNASFQPDHSNLYFYVESDNSYAVECQLVIYANHNGSWNLEGCCELCGPMVGRPCRHAMAMLSELGDDDFYFEGIFRDNTWGSEDKDIIELDANALHKPSGSGTFDELIELSKHRRPGKTWPQGARVAMRLTGGRVSMNDGSGVRYCIERVVQLSDGTFSDGDPTALDLPAEERDWGARIMSLPATSRPRVHYLADWWDAAHAVQFARAGRLFNEHGIQVELVGDESKVIRWEPSDEATQRMVIDFEEPWKWLRDAFGPLIDGTGTKLLCLPFGRETMNVLSRPHVLTDEQAIAVRDAWGKHPQLMHVMPLEPAKRVITERHATWEGEVVQLTEPLPGVAVQVRLRAGEDVVSPLLRNGQLVHVSEDSWDRYTITHNLTSVERALLQHGFTRQADETTITYAAPAGSQARFVDLLLSRLDPDDRWVRLSHKQPPTLHTLTTAKLAFSVRIVERQEGAARYEVEPACRDESLELHVPLVAQQHAEMSTLALSMGQHLGRSAGSFSRLYEIQPGQFAMLPDGAVQRIAEQWSVIRDLTTQVGSRYWLTAGGLLRLATLHELPVEASDPIDNARAMVRHLLDVQEPVAEGTINGIDGITFSRTQMSGVNWLVSLLKLGLGGVLADKRGAGKTFEALGAIALTKPLRSELGRGPALVMMELKELDHWLANHLVKHCSGIRWSVFHGLSRPTREQMLDSDVVVTTYGTFQRQPERFSEINPSFVFADEAKRLKNRQSKTWKAVAALEGVSVVSINGTPLPRNLTDVWSSFHLAAPGFLGSHQAFSKSYRNHADDEQYRDRLRRALATLWIRREIDNGKGMPSKTLLRQLVTMADTQVALYARALERVQMEIQALGEDVKKPQVRFQVRRMLDRLRDIVANPGRPGQLTSKGEVLVDMVEEFVADDHQVLVFSHSNNHVDSIAEILRRKGIATSVFRGSNARERNREKALFKDGHSRVLVLSHLGAKGLDFPEATRVVITDPWIDADEDDQMADRARRHTSTKDLEVFHLICAGTLEEGAMEILERNRERDQALMEGAPVPAPGFGAKATLDEYEYLLSFHPHASGDGDDN